MKREPFDPSLTQRVVARARSRIVPNWRSRLSDYSTKALGAVTGLAGIWVLLPADLKAGFDPRVAEYFGLVILVLGAWGTLGKFITQAPAPAVEHKERAP